MATTTNSTVSPALGSEEPESMLTPEEVVRQLRALRARIPMPLPTTAPPSLRRRLAHVNALFVAASISAVGASDNVQRAVGRNDEELRQDADAIVRWTAVADEYRACLDEIVAANVIRRQRIGLTALQTYKICQQLVRDEGQSRLAPFVAEMKRLNKFGRKRKNAQPAAEPQPQASPPPPQVQPPSTSAATATSSK